MTPTVFLASPPRYQLHGITRANVIQLARDNHIPVQECDISLTQVSKGQVARVRSGVGLHLENSGFYNIKGCMVTNPKTMLPRRVLILNPC